MSTYHPGLRLLLLTGVVLAPFLIIWFVPGTLYPVRYETALELVHAGERHEEMEEQLTGILVFQDLYPSQCFASAAAGKIMTSAGRIPEAIAHYQTAGQNNCMDEEGMLTLFSLLQMQGTEHEAIIKMEDWLLLHPDSSSSLYQLLIEQYVADQDLEQAAAWAKIWADAQPRNASAMEKAIHFAALLPADQRLKLAQHIQENTLPLSPPTHQLLESILLAAGEPEDVAVYRLGNAYSIIEEWQLAERCFSASLALEPDRAEAWASLAFTLKKQQKDPRQALAEARKRGGDSDMLRSLMGLYYRDTNPEIAYVYWMKLAANQPDVPEWLIEAGTALAQAGDIESAATLFMRAVDGSPNKVEIRAAFARFCLFYEYDIQGIGLEQTRALIRLAPENAQGYLLEGQMLLHLEDLITAERMLLQAQHLSEQSPAVLYYLGLLYQQKAEGDKAHTYLKQVTQMDDPYYARAASRLLIMPN
jgi:tetratricopeptide (TPR) repeat protein